MPTSDPTDWTSLKSVLADWLNRDDLTTQIPLFVALAERKFNRVLRVPEMETTATITLDSASEALPADFLAMRALYIDADPKTVLEPMAPATLRHAYRSAATGRPRNYAIQSGSTLIFGPAPDAAYSLVVNHYAAIPALGAGQATNWLLTAHPDLYVYGALIQAEAYLVNDGRMAVWKLALEEALEELRRQGHRRMVGQAVRLRAPIVV